MYARTIKELQVPELTKEDRILKRLLETPHKQQEPLRKERGEPAKPRKHKKPA